MVGIIIDLVVNKKKLLRTIMMTLNMIDILRVGYKSMWM